MNKDKEITLVELYPDILVNYGKSPKESCMAFGFEHGDGWYELIGDLLQELDAYCKDKDFHIIADQIKEKFGTLRFYFSYSTVEVSNKDHAAIDGIVTKYEKQSEVVCEKTGEPGSMHYRTQRGGWMKTLSAEEAKRSGFVK